METTASVSVPQPSACATLGAFDILAHCHEHILERLSRLSALADDLQRDPAFDERKLAQVADVLAFLDTVIPIHSADEEQTLFPRLRKLPRFAGTDGTPMDCMEQEHVGHRRLLAAFRRDVMLRRPADAARAARAIVAEYREHIAKENEVLFPFAREALDDPRAEAAMADEMRARRREAGLLSGC